MAAALALLSGLLWGTADFGGGLVTRRLPSLVVVGWSQAAAFVALAIGAVVTRTGPPAGPWLVWGLLTGVAGAGGLVCFYRALSTGTMGVVSPIAGLGALVPVVADLLAGHIPTMVQGIGMAVALLGAVAASGPELSGGASSSSVVLAAVAGLLFGLTFVGMDHGAVYSPLYTAIGMRLASLLLFGALAVATASLGGVRPMDLPMLAAVGIADGAANLIFSIASTMGLVSVVAVLGSLYPVATVLLARAFLAERLRPVQVVGVVAALGGVAMVSAG
ncbi:MAG: DMT family transporter [Kineosporiaceae bacterium]